MPIFDIKRITSTKNITNMAGLGGGAVVAKYLVSPQIRDRLIKTDDPEKAAKQAKLMPLLPLVLGIAATGMKDPLINALGNGMLAQATGTMIGRAIDPTGERGLGADVMLNGTVMMNGMYENGEPNAEMAYNNYESGQGDKAPDFTAESEMSH